WIDGTIIGEVLIQSGVLGVHDAIVVGNDFVNKIKSMNKATYDTGIGYDLMGSMLEALTESVGAMEKSGMLGSLGTIDMQGQAMNVSAVIDMMIEQVGIVQEARDDMYGTKGNKEITVANIADQAGTAYVGGDNELSVEYDEIINGKLKKVVSEADLTKMINDTIAKAEKEGC
ncbi:MAG: hypothetical protein DRH37_11325, partial [Deltaproteobacteria bacterium]